MCYNRAKTKNNVVCFILRKDMTIANRKKKKERLILSASKYWKRNQKNMSNFIKRKDYQHLFLFFHFYINHNVKNCYEINNFLFLIRKTFDSWQGRVIPLNSSPVKSVILLIKAKLLKCIILFFLNCLL